MKSTKIVIKCDGLTVRTKDLGMGLSILNRLKEYGIMNHIDISVKLLEKLSNTVKGLHDKLKEYLSKQSNVVEKPNDSINVVAVERTEKLNDSSESIVSDEQKKKSDDIKRTLENVIDKDALAKAFNNVTDKDKIQADDIQVKIGAEIETKDATDKVINESIKRQYRWTKEETNILKDNIDISDKELHRLIPTRTLKAIKFKKLVLLGKVKSRLISGKKFIRWTNKELKILEANMHLKPRQLRKLPWLKRKTIDQINRKKHQIKIMIVNKKDKQENLDYSEYIERLNTNIT